MEEEVDNIEEKQSYLTEEIIGKNFDQNRFVNFCLSKREGGDNLSKWKMDELKELVAEFQAKETEELQQKEEKPAEEQPQHLEENLDQHQEENLDQQPQTLSDKIESANLDSQNNEQIISNPEQNPEPKIEENKENIPGIQEPKEKEEKGEIVLEIQCQKLEKTVLNDKEIKVTVQNPAEVQNNLLSPKYVKYEVSTNVEENWLVDRRYNDFLWLRQVLIKFNPGQVIPPLPNKKIGKRRFEKDFIMKRMRYLQKFIDNVMVNEYFKASPPIIPFLSIKDRRLFEAKQKELLGFNQSPYLEDFKTFTGTVQITKEQQDNENYFTKIKSYFQNTDILCDRVKANMKRFYLGMKECSAAIDGIQKEFETFFILNDRVMMKKPITKSFEQISLFFKSYKDIVEKQNEILKKHFKDFFRFVKMEGSSYHELITNREEIKDKYLFERKKLTALKEKLWHNGDIGKWAIQDLNSLDVAKLKTDHDYAIKNMCTKETKMVDSMMKQFGYINRMNFEELKKMIDVNCERYKENVISFVDEFNTTLDDEKAVTNGMKNVMSQVDAEVLK